MSFKLTISNGAEAGRRIAVPPGPPIRVGRDAPCEVRLQGDSQLSNPHFAVALEDGVPRLRDLGSKFGTKCNGDKVTECTLRDGDVIAAGKTEFTVQWQGQEKSTGAEVTARGPAAVAPPAPSIPQMSDAVGVRDLHQFLSGIPNLYAIVDAAREATIPWRLLDAAVEHASLYEGQQGLQVAHVGPWLARLPADSPFLATAVNEGWGQSWGVFLTSNQPFAEVRHHLRRFLLVERQGEPPAYFRFYDPRVLRIYLPTCRPDDLRGFFGPIDAYLCEGQPPSELLMFTPANVEAKRVAVSVAAIIA